MSDRKCPGCGGYLRGGLYLCWDCCGAPYMDTITQVEVTYESIVSREREIHRLKSLLKEIEDIQDRYVTNISMENRLVVDEHNIALERCRKIARRRNG